MIEENVPMEKGALMQQFGIMMEHKLCSQLNCNRFDLGGFVNSDHIRRTGFIPSMVVYLSSMYNTQSNRETIDEFLNDSLYYSGTKLDDLELEVVEEIMKKFKELCNKLTK